MNKYTVTYYNSEHKITKLTFDSLPEAREFANTKECNFISLHNNKNTLLPR